jgi:hypothetical protein
MLMRASMFPIIGGFRVSLLSQPGVQARDLIEVQVLSNQLVDPADEYAGYAYQPVGSLRVYSRKLTSGEAFRQGKPETNLNYTLYSSYRRGDPYPVTEKQRIWHPEASALLDNGSPDYETALDISSVVCYASDGVCVIEASRAK